MNDNGIAEYSNFDQQILDDKLEAAESTFQFLKKQYPGARTDACLVRLQCKKSQMEEALAGLRDLCFVPEHESDVLEEAFNAVVLAQWGREAEELFKGLLGERGVNLLVGELWVKSFSSRHAWSHRRHIRELDPESPMGRRVRFVYIGETAWYKKPQYLSRLLSREEDILQKDLQCWGQVGFSLVSNKLYSEAVDWMRNWRKRTDIEPWMLANLVFAMHSLGDHSAAVEISRKALTLRPDHTTRQHQLWLALDEGLVGETEQAIARLSTLSVEGLSDFYEALYQLVEAVVSIQTAPKYGKRALFDNHRQILRQQQYHSIFSTPALHVLAKRGVKVMAKAAQARTFGLGIAQTPPVSRGRFKISAPLLFLIISVVAAALVFIFLKSCSHNRDFIPPGGTPPIQAPVQQVTPLPVQAPTPDSLRSFSKDAVRVDFKDSRGKPIEFKVDQMTAPQATPPRSQEQQ